MDSAEFREGDSHMVALEEDFEPRGYKEVIVDKFGHIHQVSTFSCTCSWRQIWLLTPGKEGKCRDHSKEEEEDDLLCFFSFYFFF